MQLHALQIDYCNCCNNIGNNMGVRHERGHAWTVNGHVHAIFDGKGIWNMNILNMDVKTNSLKYKI
jgi:hypothetical protein